MKRHAQFLRPPFSPLLGLSLLLFCTLGLSSPAYAQPKAEQALADQYFADEQYEEALDLYEKVWKQDASEALTMRVVACYERLNHFDDAIRFLDRAIKKQPTAVTLPLLKGLAYEKLGQFQVADATFADAIKKLSYEGDYIHAGSFLYQAGKLDLAKETYLAGRKKLRDNQNKYPFANELGNTYGQQGEFALATEEFLNSYYATPENLPGASLDIINLVSDASQAEIEKALVLATERDPNDLGVRQILYEFYINIGNFMEAFVQVKSMDRLGPTINLAESEGERVFQFAESMRTNKNYDMANRALDYIIDKKKNSPRYMQAFMEKAVNGELQAFEHLPVNIDAVRQAVAAYTALIDKFGIQATYFQAIYRRANLQVFYLNELDGPLADLTAITSQNIDRDDWAKAMLLIGDIQLIRQQVTDARFTYTKVSDSFRDRQTGALSKYKLAQLLYYSGDFGLSQAMLAAIKDNTSNDISNDAIKLNLTIMDNSGMDSIPTPLKRFAHAQLLIYQRQYDQAMPILDSVANAFPGHPLSDEILWEKASIYLKRNEFTTAVEYLDRILQNFPTDILGDDALYTKARLYDYTLANPELAMKYYLAFLTAYPGSLYSVEVRKRIRELRKPG